MVLLICINKSMTCSAGLLRLLLLIFVGSTVASAQDGPSSGIISGTVVDADYGGTVPVALVSVVETGQSTTSDLNGRFVITNVEPSVYTLIVSAKFYKASRIEGLPVEEGDVARVDVPMYGDTSNVVELEAVTVKAEILANSELGLLSKRQKAATVSDAIGLESLSRLGLSDAADALSKVTGASIVDGKYLVMRGLSDRYNNTTVNGTTLPSADPSRKSVQLDQFPSGLVDVISTTKTFTPNMSGEFTGGSVNIGTKAFPDRFFFQTSYGIRIDEDATDEEFLSYPGGSDDWFGRDDGSRALPELAKVPENLTARAPIEVRDELVDSFSDTMSPVRGDVPFGHNWSIAFGDSLDVLGNRLGYVASLTYRRDVNHLDDYRELRYDTFYRRSQDEWVIQTEQDFTGDRSAVDVNLGALLNLSYQLADQHEIGLKNFFSQGGRDEALFQQGESIGSEDIFLRESRLHFTERNISSHKIHGDHLFNGWNDLRLEWDYAKSRTSQDEPDFRLFFDRVRLDDYPDPEPSDWGFPVGLTNQRLFRELQEDGDEYGIDLTIPIPFFGERSVSAKLGYRLIEAERSYDEVALGFGLDPRGGGVPYRGDRDAFLDDEYAGFDSEGILRRVIIDVTDFVPTYDGDREVEAGYAMVDAQVTPSLRLVAGVRKEDTMIWVQTIDRFDESVAGGVGEINDDSILPAINATWTMTDRQNLRLAFSKTVARPNFRELSPVAGYSAIATTRIVGNPELEMTSIRNYDLRWEFFGEDGGLLAASVFYKKLENPIEQTVNFLNQQTWQNVPQGTVQGLELEARKQLNFLSSENRSVEIGGNLTLVESEVDRTEDELLRKRVFDPEISEARELQGQSEVVANIDLSVEWYKFGSLATLSYNYTGERLYEVSVAQLPDVYEQPGDQLDFIFSQRFGENWKTKFKVGNILNSRDESLHEFFGDRYLYSMVEPGRTYSLSMSYEFR